MMFIFVSIVGLFLFLGIKDKIADWGVNQVRRDARAGRTARNFMILLIGGALFVAATKNKHSSSSSTSTRFQVNDAYSSSAATPDLTTSVTSETPSAVLLDSVQATPTPDVFADIKFQPAAAASPSPEIRGRKRAAEPVPSASPYIEVRRALPVDASHTSGLR